MKSVKEIFEFILIIIILIIFWFACVKEVKNYLKYKDEVIKVEATVVDSINYIETSSMIKDKDNRNNYYSSAKLQWKVNNEEYNVDRKFEGTVLKGDKYTFTVLKNKPWQIKNVSLKHTLEMFLVVLLITCIFIGASNFDKIIDWFAERKETEEEKYLERYGGEYTKKIIKLKREKRGVALILICITVLFANTIWSFVKEYKNYKVEERNKYVLVDAMILQAENYEEDGRIYTDVLAQWQYKGREYKKILCSLKGQYEMGERYKLSVLEDTKESLKLKLGPTRKDVIKALGMAVFFTLMKGGLIFWYMHCKRSIRKIQ